MLMVDTLVKGLNVLEDTAVSNPESEKMFMQTLVHLVDKSSVSGQQMRLDVFGQKGLTVQGALASQSETHQHCAHICR